MCFLPCDGRYVHRVRISTFNASMLVMATFFLVTKALVVLLQPLSLTFAIQITWGITEHQRNYFPHVQFCPLSAWTMLAANNWPTPVWILSYMHSELTIVSINIVPDICLSRSENYMIILDQFSCPVWVGRKVYVWIHPKSLFPFIECGDGSPSLSAGTKTSVPSLLTSSIFVSSE